MKPYDEVLKIVRELFKDEDFKSTTNELDKANGFIKFWSKGLEYVIGNPYGTGWIVSAADRRGTFVDNEKTKFLEQALKNTRKDYDDIYSQYTDLDKLKENFEKLYELAKDVFADYPDKLKMHDYLYTVQFYIHEGFEDCWCEFGFNETVFRWYYEARGVDKLFDTSPIKKMIGHLNEVTEYKESFKREPNLNIVLLD